MEKLLVTFSGIGLIGLIYWFFFGTKENSMSASDQWTITVDGGYKPSTIKVHKNKPATLTFLRKDSNSCLEEIIFPDYKIKKYLPLNKPVVINLSPPHPAKNGFHCGMNMFRGKINVG